jgi:hypothetical protein
MHGHSALDLGVFPFSAIELCGGHRPTDDKPGEQVDHRSNVEPTAALREAPAPEEAAASLATETKRTSALRLQLRADERCRKAGRRTGLVRPGWSWRVLTITTM